MKVYNKNILLFVLLTLSTTGFSQPVQINTARYSNNTKESDLQITLSEIPKYRAFILENPARLVIDFSNTQAKWALPQPSKAHPLFSKVNIIPKNGNDVRVLIALKQPLTANNHKLTIKANDNHHLTVQLQTKETASPIESKKLTEKFTSHTKNNPIKPTELKVSNSKVLSSKQHFIVAIDAGHGGDDPGAKGPSGTYEKTVTLAIAKKLQTLINQYPNLKAKLVRRSDNYVGLRERMKIARKLGADLFVSIHADACDNPDVNGASVYTLSSNGASSEAARWLANNENSKEKLSGIDLEDKDDVLASVLMDLSQTATQQASVTLANKVLKNFQNIGTLHYNTVQKAGFAVLKSPDIPSILVETAYISNPSDELNLLSSRYQTKMANAIFNGIKNYFEQMDPAELNRIAKI